MEELAWGISSLFSSGSLFTNNLKYLLKWLSWDWDYIIFCGNSAWRSFQQKYERIQPFLPPISFSFFPFSFCFWKLKLQKMEKYDEFFFQAKKILPSETSKEAQKLKLYVYNEVFLSIFYSFLLFSCFFSSHPLANKKKGKSFNCFLYGN